MCKKVHMPGVIMWEKERWRSMRSLIVSKDKFITRPIYDLALRATLCSLFLAGDQGNGKALELFKVIDGSAEMMKRDTSDIVQFSGGVHTWYITYDGTDMEYANLDIRKVYAISVFEEDDEYHGNKMIFLARRIIAMDEKNREENICLKDTISMALYEHLAYLKDNKIGWAEVYGDLETCFHKVYSYREVIDPYDFYIPEKPDNFVISLDEFHYCRNVSDFESPLLIAYGNLNLGWH